MRKKLPRRLFLTLLAALPPALAGCSVFGKKKRWDEGLTVARFLVEARQGDLASRVRLPVSGTVIGLEARAVLTELDITDVALAEGELGPLLVFSLTPGAARDFYRFTVQNGGRRLVLFVDTLPLGARLIDKPVQDGAVMIYPEMERRAAADLAQKLRESAARIQEHIANQR
ncbi:MAG: hypothetical protein LBR12_06550 [Opitutaceae bacterium]|jgi:preprotein translocase subunit SecD|nr:hypothetical protein [Opitutaceae bacterium]